MITAFQLELQELSTSTIIKNCKNEIHDGDLIIIRYSKSTPPSIIASAKDRLCSVLQDVGLKQVTVLALSEELKIETYSIIKDRFEECL